MQPGHHGCQPAALASAQQPRLPSSRGSTASNRRLVGTALPTRQALDKGVESSWAAATCILISFRVKLMFPTSLKTFVHPDEVYRLDYPGHWDQVQQDKARSCGFGPHDRDDVGLWISIMPMSLDTDRLADELPKMMEQV